MEPQDSPDLDGAIDDVARAMTSAGLARDLRPALAARLAARRPWWPIGWRVATAGAAIAAVAIAVATVSRSGGEAQPPQPQSTRVESRGGGLVVARATPTPAVAPAVRPQRRVARQAIDPAAETAAVVAMTPVAIVPLADDGVGLEEMEPARQVEIAPIDVEPLRISGLGELVE